MYNLHPKGILLHYNLNGIFEEEDDVFSYYYWVLSSNCSLHTPDSLQTTT